eukprot:CAMPEP_0206486732 /NCGR_PEP_ID=MMETSP0324_2-20121206/41204_1 /ASSEMBLY_ACC=CAM_ASM_000836 /TAXON_ID=2866 /ORGANISM="Crypthecodinium cohnii, Strain Seligo" /LENGTH=86 /DNA_ID=CAMNT_0053965045 /DNA_START=1028 /DNA_END=1286 /DNA_ORIENTATION=-
MATFNFQIDVVAADCMEWSPEFWMDLVPVHVWITLLDDVLADVGQSREKPLVRMLLYLLPAKGLWQVFPEPGYRRDADDDSDHNFH